MSIMSKKDYKEIFPANRVSGTINVSSDKSISHRAIIFAALASGKSIIKNFLYAQDCINTLKVFEKCLLGLPNLRPNRRSDV